MKPNMIIGLIITGLVITSISLFIYAKVQLLICTEQVPIVIEQLGANRYIDSTYSYVYEGETYFFRPDSTSDYVWINPEKPEQIIQPEDYYRTSQTLFLIGLMMFLCYIFVGKEEKQN